MTDATLITKGTRPAVRLERHLPDPPATVWRALTEREQLRAWFPCDVILHGGEWVPGAAITFPFPPEVIDMTLTGKVLEVDEPNSLAFTWGEDTLRLALSERAGGTDLVLINELAPSGAARNAAGWDTCLDRLVGLDPVPDNWQEHFLAYAAAFEPVVGPQEGRRRATREESRRSCAPEAGAERAAIRLRRDSAAAPPSSRRRLDRHFVTGRPPVPGVGLGGDPWVTAGPRGPREPASRPRERRAP